MGLVVVTLELTELVIAVDVVVDVGAVVDVVVMEAGEAVVVLMVVLTVNIVMEVAVWTHVFPQTGDHTCEIWYQYSCTAWE